MIEGSHFHLRDTVQKEPFPLERHCAKGAICFLWNKFVNSKYVAQEIAGPKCSLQSNISLLHQLWPGLSTKNVYIVFIFLVFVIILYYYYNEEEKNPLNFGSFSCWASSEWFVSVFKYFYMQKKMQVFILIYIFKLRMKQKLI